jgi:hypothetical protein
MKLIDMPSRQLVECLNRRGLGGYLRVALATPWANLEEALAQVDVDCGPVEVTVFPPGDNQAGPPRPQGNRRWNQRRPGKDTLCYHCCQPGHFAMDCPHPPPGQVSNQGEASTSKGPAVSLITSAVQLVTTRSCTRTEQWAEQDRVCGQVQHWVEEANAQQNAEIQTQETQHTANGKQVLTESTGPSSGGTEPDISDLA